PIDWTKVKAGEVYRPASAPDIAKKPFNIECEIRGENPSGVIIAHGGSAVGYSLYIKDGNVVFAVRHGSGSIERVTTPAAAGDLEIAAAIAKDGTMSLILNDGGTTKSKSPGLIDRHPQEDLCIGHDNKNPVDSNAPSAAFQGEIIRASVSLQ
ncbi:MAG: hypothetical protein AAF585_09575, partial [Verrucomicrobiota bacterium]